jgi:hypothetical protein
VQTVGDFDENDKQTVEGCAVCYDIWRKVHVNPGTERAGE